MEPSMPLECQEVDDEVTTLLQESTEPPEPIRVLDSAQDEENEEKVMELDEAKDILLAVRLACLCDLSYYNSSICTDPESVQAEALLLERLGVSEYKIWDHLIDKEIATQALTGVFSAESVKEQFAGSVPFVCFRGTKGADDLMADLMSLLVDDFVTVKNNRIGFTGRGFLSKRSALLDLKLLDWCVEATSTYGGILICGHSLGGVLATLFSAELRYDYPDVFETHHITLVTFGSPRVFDKETALIVNDKGKLYRHLRFVNDHDVITMLPLANLNSMLCHSGEVYFASVLSNGFRKLADADFNFSPEPLGDICEMLRQVLSFAVTEAGTHLMAVQRGYLDRLINSASYQQALDLQAEDIGEYFAALPIVISQSHELTANRLEAINDGLLRMKHNVELMEENVTIMKETIVAHQQAISDTITSISNTDMTKKENYISLSVAIGILIISILIYLYMNNPSTSDKGWWSQYTHEFEI